MTDRAEEKPEPRKPYRKPTLTQVALKPEEAVLGFCKNNTSSGPAAATCTTLACATSGS
jgi:hypothetical protein